MRVMGMRTFTGSGMPVTVIKVASVDFSNQVFYCRVSCRVAIITDFEISWVLVRKPFSEQSTIQRTYGDPSPFMVLSATRRFSSRSSHRLKSTSRLESSGNRHDATTALRFSQDTELDLKEISKWVYLGVGNVCPVCSLISLQILSHYYGSFYQPNYRIPPKQGSLGSACWPRLHVKNFESVRGQPKYPPNSIIR